MSRPSAPPVLCDSLIEALHGALPACEDDPDAQPEVAEARLEADLAAFVAGLDAREIWVFGYGSLMWNPEMDFTEQRTAGVAAWSRRFCLWQWRYRGSRSQPGLMLALDEGPGCTGVAFRLAGEDLAARLRPVWWREMRGRGYRPEFVTCQTSAGPVEALTFVANRTGPRYAGALAEAEIARNIARARGIRGTSASYLLNTWRHCRAAGIEDPMLERLQRLVARELADLAAR